MGLPDRSWRGGQEPSNRQGLKTEEGGKRSHPPSSTSWTGVLPANGVWHAAGASSMQPAQATLVTGPVWLVFSSFTENTLIRIRFVSDHLERQGDPRNSQFTVTSVTPTLLCQVGLPAQEPSHPPPESPTSLVGIKVSGHWASAFLPIVPFPPPFRTEGFAAPHARPCAHASLTVGCALFPFSSS